MKKSLSFDFDTLDDVPLLSLLDYVRKRCLKQVEAIHESGKKLELLEESMVAYGCAAEDIEAVISYLNRSFHDLTNRHVKD